MFTLCDARVRNSRQSTRNMSIQTLSAGQLREAAAIKDKIESLQSELNSLLGGGGEAGNGVIAAPRRGRPPGKRTMSPAAWARIAAAARARWKKAKAAGKNSL